MFSWGFIGHLLLKEDMVLILGSLGDRRSRLLGRLYALDFVNESLKCQHWANSRNRLQVRAPDSLPYIIAAITCLGERFHTRRVAVGRWMQMRLQLYIKGHKRSHMDGLRGWEKVS